MVVKPPDTACRGTQLHCQSLHCCAAGLLGDSQLREGFVSGFLLILFSELGDKTFFIAVLLALKYREAQGLVFAGSFGALAVMTVISVRWLMLETCSCPVDLIP